MLGRVGLPGLCQLSVTTSYRLSTYWQKPFCQHLQFRRIAGALSSRVAPCTMKLIDIGANLLDGMYNGQYNDKQYHPADLDAVLARAWAAGLERIIITAGNLEESKAALDLARSDSRLYCTAGVHPTRCGEIGAFPDGADEYMRQLEEVVREGAAEGKLVAVGECGLDYDRLHFCDAEKQREGFQRHFGLAEKFDLPMFLHCRAAAADLASALEQNRSSFKGGVVHSFDGTREDLDSLLSFEGVYIGINGCSLKTADNLEVMAAVPLSRLLIETDAPWCEVRPSHAGYSHVRTRPPAKDRKKWDHDSLVKGRNEPACLVQVLEVVAGYRAMSDLEELADTIYSNTMSLFFRGRA